MARKAAWIAALVVLPLALGAGNAASRTATVTTVTVEVIGKGRVVSDPTGIACGDGKKVCYLTFTTNSTISLQAKDTASGWNFHRWDDDCAGTHGDTCNLDPGGDYLVTANYEGPATTTSTLSVGHTEVGTSSGSVTGPETAPPGSEIDCGSSTGSHGLCAWQALTGSTLTVFQTPDSDSVFSGWAGACSGTAVSCTVELDGDQSVNATWTDASAATSTLTVTIAGNGTVAGGGVTCSGPATCTREEPFDGTVTLTATPASGFLFTGWTGTTGCTGLGTTCTLTMDADRTVTATFSVAVPLTVTVNGSGNVSGGAGAINCGTGATVCSANLALNSTVTLVATSSTGGSFTGWTGACGGTATTCTVLMSAARDVTATFTGGTTGGGGATVSLSVSVSGNGTVVGGGISCGSNATVCSANQAPNAIVTLSALPSTGATFNGWGGACIGTTPTCSVTMTSAKTVTATFAGGTPPTVSLIVTVTGNGTVKGGAIDCGNGRSACTASVAQGTSVTLTETPAKGASFSGWGGACFASGKKATCTVTVSASTSVTAGFAGGTGPPPTGTTGLTSLGIPIVKHGATGYLVSLRFRTSTGGGASVRGLRAGRLATSLSVRVPAGTATIGPFPVVRAGLYVFELRLGGHVLRWSACLGRCGAAATAPPFVLTRETPVVTRAGAVWSVTLRFVANAISDAHIRVLRGGRLLADHHFLAGAREIVVGPFLLGPGSYTLVLRAADAYGRVRTLDWIVDLAH
jgi:uncharacterized repeat protein (TIGR02543 family)